MAFLPGHEQRDKSCVPADQLQPDGGECLHGHDGPVPTQPQAAPGLQPAQAGGNCKQVMQQLMQFSSSRSTGIEGR